MKADSSEEQTAGILAESRAGKPEDLLWMAKPIGWHERDRA